MAVDMGKWTEAILIIKNAVVVASVSRARAVKDNCALRSDIVFVPIWVLAQVLGVVMAPN